MKKQFILAGAGLVAVMLLFFFGRTTEKNGPSPVMASPPGKVFDVDHFIADAKHSLPASQSAFIGKIENGITHSNTPNQQVESYNSLANFWKDSAKRIEPYLFYLAKAAKLDNSEKNLTFAAQLFLEGLREEQDEAKLNWLTIEAIDLFERAIKTDPANDDLRIGLGSSYVYGRGRNGKPQETMKGIQELLAVARKDSNNMKAQLVLGVGGLVSGQFDKALERFQRVIRNQPNNLEAIAYLADTYAAKGNKDEAIKWYTISKRLANNPHYSEEVDNRINSLR